MDMSAEDDFFKQRGFGLTIGFGLRPAVLVVDIIQAFTDPESMLGSKLDGQVLAIQALLAPARRSAVPIIFSTVSYDQADFTDAGIWALKQKGVTTLRAGTPAVALDPRLVSSVWPEKAGWSRNMHRASSVPI